MEPPAEMDAVSMLYGPSISNHEQFLRMRSRQICVVLRSGAIIELLSQAKCPVLLPGTWSEPATARALDSIENARHGRLRD